MQVFGDQDADGFYYGECSGQRGLVPSNIVAVVEVDDAEAAMQLLDDSCQSVAPDSSVTSSRASSQTSPYTTAHQQGISIRVMLKLLRTLVLNGFIQGISIACYAEPCITYGRVVRLSVSLSHAGTE